MNKIYSISVILTITLSLAISSAIATQPFMVFAEPSMIPVVILFKDDHITSKHVDLINSHDGEITRSYKIISGVAANIPEPAIEALKKNPRVASVDLDVEIKAVGLVADQQIGADQVWPSFTGNGVRVAILDTGIDTKHQEFSGRIVGCHSEFRDPDNCNDKNGHGTFSSGIAGASGVYANAKGVAPEIHFLIDQVLDNSGSGSLSGLISGIEWAVNNNAKVASMSLSTDPIINDTTPENCDEVFLSLTTAINNAWDDGMIVVAATGNDGVDNMGAPACISRTIAVGAVDSSDSIASFSNYGLAMEDHGIVAPGVDIISTYTKFGGYARGSGTSMATPVVSGTIALMLEANQNLTPQTIKQTLFGTACSESTCPTGAVPNEIYGFGRVDAKAAVDAVVVSPGNRSPTANAGGSYNGIEDSLIQFDGSGSSDLDDDPLTYTWNFGDGSNPVQTISSTISHTYGWGATFEVTLTVTDGRGGSDTATTSAVVVEVNDVPVADPNGPYSGTVGQPVSFDGSGSSDYDNEDGTDSNNQALTYSWDFGDGNNPVQTTSPTISHTYSTIETFSVSLTVSDGTDGTDSLPSTTTATINAVSADVSVEDITPNTVQLGGSVIVTITGKNFAAGAQVSLSGGSGPISVSNVSVDPDVNIITATITAKDGGPPRDRVWDVTVTNPDGSSGTLDNGFKVEYIASQNGKSKER